MAKRRYKKKKLTLGKVILFILIVAILYGAYYYYQNVYKKKNQLPVEGELSFHFMMLGNDHSGDSVYIKAGDNDILIDAGSETNSVDEIKNYVNQYCTDGKLEYVIATHADSDHIAGFAGTTKANTSIFDFYDCGTIIDFPRTEKDTATYNRYVEKRDKEVQEGAKHFTALECYNQSKEGALRSYQLADSVYMNILYNYFYDHDASKENDYSVCVMFTHGDRNFLFTGDLERAGEEHLKNSGQLTQVELYKSGHHGSKTSSTTDFLKAIKPKKVVITCCAAEPEYGDGYGFPHQETINNISIYTDKVYVVSTCDPTLTNGAEYVGLNGNIVVVSAENDVTVNCSVTNAVLKDLEWFRKNRTMPSAWVS
ncbi:MAG: MBL fold metallo-hydrolase [Clostridia bacterium]|nr:MBL fold metallo-hydrolase [Clostridia bacterium]